MSDSFWGTVRDVMKEQAGSNVIYVPNEKPEPSRLEIAAMILPRIHKHGFSNGMLHPKSWIVNECFVYADALIAQSKEPK